MTIATLPEFKAYVTLKGTADDGLIERLLAASEAFIRSYVDRPLASPAAAFTDKLDGGGKDYTLLHFYPIVSITSVVVDGQALGLSAVEFGDADLNDSRLLYRTDRQVFPRGRRNIIVTGTYGWTAWPEDLKQAQLELVNVRYKERDRLGEVSKQVAGETVSYATSDLLKPTKMILESYRNKVPR